jgi:nucleotide sugar dehydrogenase
MNDAPTTGLECASNRAQSERRKVVCVQGLGFVGAAVCIAVAIAQDLAGRPAYNVIGIDQPTPDGLARIAALNRGMFPFHTTDTTLTARVHEVHTAGNLLASATPAAFASADIIIIDVPLDVTGAPGHETVEMASFVQALTTVGCRMAADALVIVETTLPPGTTERVVVPTLTEELERRGVASDQFCLAHCYERVTPGETYLDSIVSMPRVYAGIDERSAVACEAFLRSIASSSAPPPTRLSSTTASELSKVLENSYRAVTIALMDEFAAFSEAAGVDLNEIIAPIRQRPTHNNMRTPGFGVGGYCLTKDPLLARLAARDFFGLELSFPFSTLAVETNRATPLRVLGVLRGHLGGTLNGRRILLLGVSYRPDVDDTRHSASGTFFDAALSAGATILVQDPIVRFWRERNLAIDVRLPAAEGLDAVVLAVPHRQYRQLDFKEWLADARPVIFDAFQVLTRAQHDDLRAFGCTVESIGGGRVL